MSATGDTGPAVVLAPGARVHLVGIGGAGMSALATVLAERGHPVSGSDQQHRPALAELAALGVEIHVGHDARTVEPADLVARSTAVRDASPELVRARALGIPVIGRAQLLVALLDGHRGVLVAGTHGKTTTTAMATAALRGAGLDPSYAIGGVLAGTATGAHAGSGEVFLAEADESDRSFLAYAPDLAVVTNVELDHPDAYVDLEDVQRAFAGFLERRTPGGTALVCADDPGARALLASAPRAPVVTYGEADDADWRIGDVVLAPRGSSFRIARGGVDLGRVTLAVPGRHNVGNATAALAVAAWAGADLAPARAALAGFAGARRRFELLGEAGGVTVVDDYAIHPTEIDVVLTVARGMEPVGRVVAICQPHRYTRTRTFGSALGEALAAADMVVVTEVYAAGEDPLPGVDGALVADAVAAAGTEVHRVADAAALPAALARLVAPGDLVVTLGAGDVTAAGPALLELLRARTSAGAAEETGRRGGDG